MKKRFNEVKNSVKGFIKSEKGYTAESLAWNTVVGLGAATIAFGIYAAARFNSGGIDADIQSLQTATSLPTATEQVSSVQAGYTGAVTGLVINP